MEMHSDGHRHCYSDGWAGSRRFSHRPVRLARICAGLFFVWVISGVLEAMGIPIREWMQGIASQLPDLGVLLKAFLERLLFTAS